MQQKESEPNPTKPSFIFQMAKYFDRRYRISSRLGLTEEKDRKTATYELTKRLLKTSIYDSSWLLSQPSVVVGLALPILSSLVHSLDRRDRKDRQQLTDLETELSGFLQAAYPSPEERYRARTIELAINDLVARATPQGREERMYRFRPTEEMLSAWQERWQGQLKQPA